MAHGTGPSAIVSALVNTATTPGRALAASLPPPPPCRPPPGHLAGGIFYRSPYVRVPGAAAKVAVDAFANLGISRVGMVLQQVMRAHDHTRRAEAALQAVLLPESLLDGMQRVALGQALHRGYLAAIGLEREHGTGFHSAPIEQDGTGPAQRSLAAHVSAGESGYFAQKMDQKQPRLHFRVPVGSVHIYGDTLPHKSPPEQAD